MVLGGGRNDVIAVVTEGRPAEPSTSAAEGSASVCVRRWLKSVKQYSPPRAPDTFRAVETVDVKWDALGTDHDLEDYLERIDQVRMEDTDW